MGLAKFRPESIKGRTHPGFQMLKSFGRDREDAIRSEYIRPKLVACDLLLHEPVVRLVIVKGLDHIIAITPGIWVIRVGLIAGAVRVSHHVQPVARPSLAVL